MRALFYTVYSSTRNNRYERVNDGHAAHHHHGDAPCGNVPRRAGSRFRDIRTGCTEGIVFPGTCSAAPANCSTPCRRSAVNQGARPHRIATLAWNHQQHLELYYGVICGGYVLHTINPRLFDDQVTYIINHADDKWLFIDHDFVPLLERLRPQLNNVKGVVVIEPDDDLPENLFTNVHSYEHLLSGQDDNCAWPELDEFSACAMCYTLRYDRKSERRALFPQVAAPAYPVRVIAGYRWSRP